MSSKRNMTLDNSEKLDSLKYRINNIVKSSRKQSEMETVLRIKNKIINRQEFDVDQFLVDLEIIEANQITFDTFKKRFDKTYEDLHMITTLLGSLQESTVPEIGENFKIYDIFETAHKFMDQLKHISAMVPDFDQVEFDDIIGYTDLLIRIEQFTIDFKTYIKRLKRAIQENLKI